MLKPWCKHSSAFQRINPSQNVGIFCQHVSSALASTRGRVKKAPNSFKSSSSSGRVNTAICLCDPTTSIHCLIHYAFELNVTISVSDCAMWACIVSNGNYLEGASACKGEKKPGQLCCGCVAVQSTGHGTVESEQRCNCHVLALRARKKNDAAWRVLWSGKGCKAGKKGRGETFKACAAAAALKKGGSTRGLKRENWKKEGRAQWRGA